MTRNKISLEEDIEGFQIPFRENLLYYLFAGLRVVLTCVPQVGYIHPDEYFQSIEVVSGDVFDIDVRHPWEYNRTFPIRSIVLPYITVGIPYRILRMLDLNFASNFRVDLKTPYFLLVMPRIFVCLCSFLVDYSLYRSCRTSHESHNNKLLVLASSYVMLMYGTRTFSNTVEMVLLSILLCLVADCQAYSHAIIRQTEYLADRYRKAKAAVDRARLYKLRLSLPPHSLRHCISVSVITVFGVFNRPTFIAFAFVPLFFWFHRGLGCKSVSFTEFHCRMFLFLLCCALMTIFFIIFDSFYFGYISMAEIQQLDVSMNNFIVTPVNFVKYNLEWKNLAEHGLHPRFLHVLVNVPLLYNVLGAVALAGFFIMCCRLVMGRYTALPRIHSIRGLMTGSIIVPVAFLSYFPHQEPRFLIPITMPIVLLYGGYIARKRTLMKIWFIINALCLVFYGFIHQAGLYPASVHLAKDVRLYETARTPMHLVTSHIYSLPVSLLQVQSTKRIYGRGTTKYTLPKTLFLQEMGSESIDSVARRLSAILQVSRLGNDGNPVKYKSKVFLLLPTSKGYEFNSVIQQYDIKIHKVQVFYPHISTEALPNLFHNRFTDLFQPEFSAINSLVDLLQSCGLGLYEIHRMNSTKILSSS